MGEENATGLPASIEAAWGLRGRPGRGPRPGLSLERIVEAGIRVADADGLAAVSMSRVAKDLGASTMSLYRYVAAKDELLELMADAAYGTPLAEDWPDRGWRDGLAAWARAELAAIRRHPWVVKIPISGPPSTPNQVGWMEVALSCLRGTGLGPAEKMSVLLLVSSYVRSVGLLGGELMTAALAAGVTPDQVMADYVRTMKLLTAGQRFPELRKVLDSGVLDQADGPDDEFEFGLARILDGVESLVVARR